MLGYVLHAQSQFYLACVIFGTICLSIKRPVLNHIALYNSCRRCRRHPIRVSSVSDGAHTLHTHTCTFLWLSLLLFIAADAPACTPCWSDPCIVQLVKYAADGQRGLQAHVDSAPFSFVLQLNAKSCFTGGGTHFPHLQHTFSLEQGDVLIFPGGKLFHAGVDITSGERYILAGFVMCSASTSNTDSRIVQTNQYPGGPESEVQPFSGSAWNASPTAGFKEPKEHTESGRELNAMTTERRSRD